MNIDPTQLITPDVAAKTAFLTELRRVSQQWVVFKEGCDFNETRSVFSRSRSFLLEDRQAVKADTERVRALLKEVTDVKLPSAQMLTAAGVQSAIRKMELLTSLVSLLPSFRSRMIQAVRRLQVRNSQISQRQHQQIDPYNNDDVFLQCPNPLKLTWDETLGCLIDCQSENGPANGPLSVDELIIAAQLLRASNVVPLDDFLKDGMYTNLETIASASDIRDPLVAWLPVMSVHRGRDGRCVLHNSLPAD